MASEIGVDLGGDGSGVLQIFTDTSPLGNTFPRHLTRCY
jgi:hypothetical protein